MAKEVEKEQFLLFTTSTIEDRTEVFGFSTQGEFSKKYGVSEKTLSGWKKDPRFKKRHRELLENKWQYEQLVNVSNITYKQALAGDQKAADNFYKLAGFNSTNVKLQIEQDISTVVLTLVDIVKRHITDETILQAIAEEIDQEIGDL